MRINVIPVKDLADIHLRAEYREILMSPHYYHTSKKSSKGIDMSKIPKKYTLNKGHAYFWYNKYGYIRSRHNELEKEMIRRGFKIRETDSMTPLLEGIPIQHRDFWFYDIDDVYVNIERIIRRIYEMYYVKDKPHFYKFWGESKTFDEWVEYYKKVLDLPQSFIDNILTEIRKDNETIHKK